MHRQSSEPICSENEETLEKTSTFHWPSNYVPFKPLGTHLFEKFVGHSNYAWHPNKSYIPSGLTSGLCYTRGQSEWCYSNQRILTLNLNHLTCIKTRILRPNKKRWTSLSIQCMTGINIYVVPSHKTHYIFIESRKAYSKHVYCHPHTIHVPFHPCIFALYTYFVNKIKSEVICT